MKQTILFCTRIFLCLAVLTASAAAAVDHDPRNAGTTMARNNNGTACEAAWYNPALLGVDLPPTGGLLLFPVTNAGIGYWSDKLAVSPFNRYWAGSAEEYADLTSKIFRKSFRLEGLEGQALSDRLTKKLEGGLGLYAGARTSLFSIAHKRFSFDITTHADEEIHIPEGPLFLAFSADKGLLRGNTLDFSTFRQEAVWATDFSFNIGLPVTIPALHDLFKLEYGAGGLGVRYIMGHSILRATTDKGSLTYNQATNALEVDGSITVQTAGAGMGGALRFNNPFEAAGGLPVSGHGIGIDLGGILYDENASLSINFQNVGVLFWMNGTKEVTYRIKKNDLDIYQIIQGVDASGGDGDSASLTIFDRNANEYLSDSRDTLQESDGFVTFLPMALNVAWSYRWDFSKLSNRKGITYLGEHGLFAVQYLQQLVRGPGTSHIPRLSLGGELGTLKGVLPLRMGFVVGGAERIASALGLGINLKYFSLQASYKAVGTPFFVPRRGMELAGGINVNWGMHAKPHRDTLPPPRADTLIIRDTIIRVDTLQIHDTTIVRDTVTVIKLQPTEKEQKAVSKALQNINFVTASAELMPNSYAHLNFIVDFLRQYNYLRYEIQGHTDSQGSDDYNLLLSAARSATVRNYLVGQGIADSVIIAIGYGESKPVATNATAAGRAQNRRVEFRAIESQAEYERLRALENDFRFRVYEAQIKGAQY